MPKPAWDMYRTRIISSVPRGSFWGLAPVNMGFAAALSLNFSLELMKYHRFYGGTRFFSPKLAKYHQDCLVEKFALRARAPR